jgi:hypothetical protein
VTALDPGAATGQQPYEPTVCECGHLVTHHVFNVSRMRATCSAHEPEPCGCRLFVAAEAVSRG